MIRKLICSIVSVIMTLLCTIVSFTSTACAESSYGIQLRPDGRVLIEGGLNKYDGELCTSESDVILLETRLRKSGYLLINTEFRDIPQDEYELIQTHTFWYSDYFRDDVSYYEKFYRIYVYAPVYYDVLDALGTGGGSVSAELVSEMDISSVVLSYGFWDVKNKAGTIDDEINENIPEWYEETGWLLIDCPISAKITLQELTRNRYYEFYVTGNELFDVKLKQGCYVIVDVSGTSISADNTEETLPYKNYIWIEGQNTEDNPYKVELESLIQKYDIQPVDVSGMPDLSYYKNQDIPVAEEEVMLPEEEEETEEEKHCYLWVVIVIPVAVAGVCTFLYIQKRKENDY